MYTCYPRTLPQKCTCLTSSLPKNVLFTITSEKYISPSQDHCHNPYQFYKTTLQKIYLFHKTITKKMWLFHKTIVINSTCFTKPSAKYISVSQDHCYKTYLFYQTISKDMNQIQKTIITNFTHFRKPS